MKADTRRWLERGKTLLILLLSISAVFLVSRSPLIQSSGLTDLIAGGKGVTSGSVSAPASLTAAAIPTRMAVGSSLGLYGVQYDQDTVDQLFDQAGPLLGEALRTAEAPAALSQSQWRARLEGQCVFFDFSSPIPLSALCAWLNDGTENAVFTGPARWILLAAESDGTLSLCYADEAGSYSRCSTALNAELHLAPIVSSCTPNNAFFAFQDRELTDVTAPYTLFTSEEFQGVIYNSSTPSILSDSAQTELLLDALSFSGQNRAAVSEGALFVDGDDTLRLSYGGTVRYDSYSSGKYPVGEGLTAAVDASWALANASLTPYCGDARLQLLSAVPDEDGDGYTVTFGYVLNGSAVQLYDHGWAARFRIQDGAIQHFTLYLRTYTASSQQALLLPADKAAAALTALSDEPLELVIHYYDSGISTVSPGWIGR